MEVMDRTVMMISVRAMPGQRDRVRGLWDGHLRQWVAASRAQEVYLVVEDADDPDLLHLVEVYNDPQEMQRNAQAPWFADYLQQVEPLLAGSPQMRTGRPVWGKGVRAGVVTNGRLGEESVRYLPHTRRSSVAVPWTWSGSGRSPWLRSRRIWGSASRACGTGWLRTMSRPAARKA
jgi:quinol monooxygenase YgiN